MRGLCIGRVNLLVMVCCLAVAQISAAEDLVFEKPGLTDYTIQDLVVPSRSDLQTRGPSTPVIPLTLGRDKVELKVSPYSVRSDDFRLLVVGENGFHFDTPPPQPHTYRGTIRGEKGSRVALSIADGKTKGIIYREDKTAWTIQPLSDVDPAASPSAHLVFRADASSESITCGTEPTTPPLQAKESFEGSGGGEPTTNSEGILVAKIAFDTDTDLFVLMTNSIEAVVDYVESVMNAVNIIYERDVSITHDISAIIVRTREPDPMTITNGSASALTEIDEYWNDNYSSIPRDVTHYLTGFDRSPEGQANYNSICITHRSYSYSEYISDFHIQTWLVAHELGHNWSAGHYTGTNASIMCTPYSSCGNTNLYFGDEASSSISNFAANLGCSITGLDLTLSLSQPAAILPGSNFVIHAKASMPSDEAFWHLPSNIVHLAIDLPHQANVIAVTNSQGSWELKNYQIRVSPGFVEFNSTTKVCILLSAPLSHTNHCELYSGSPFDPYLRAYDMESGELLYTTEITLPATTVTGIHWLVRHPNGQLLGALGLQGWSTYRLAAIDPYTGIATNYLGKFGIYPTDTTPSSFAVNPEGTIFMMSEEPEGSDSSTILLQDTNFTWNTTSLVTVAGSRYNSLVYNPFDRMYHHFFGGPVVQHQIINPTNYNIILGGQVEGSFILGEVSSVSMEGYGYLLADTSGMVYRLASDGFGISMVSTAYTIEPFPRGLVIEQPHLLATKVTAWIDFVYGRTEIDPSNNVDLAITAMIQPEEDFNDLDSDCDGMLNGYENSYGLNPFHTGDAFLDPDLDGSLNIEEFVADTDPFSESSHFTISAISGYPTSFVTFASSTGRVYSLEYLDPFWTNTWQTVTGQLNVSGTGTNQMMDPEQVYPRKFRVKVGLP